MSALLLGCIARQRRNVGSSQGWNPSDKGANIVLSGTRNAIVTGGTGAWQSVRSVTSHANGSGKFYFEVENTIDGSSHNLTACGVCDSGMSLANYVGATANGIGMFFGIATPSGTGFSGILHLPPADPAVSSQIFAIDLVSKMGWIGDASGYPSGGNPAIAASPTFTWTAAYTLFAVGSVFGGGTLTLNTGQRPFRNASLIPAGFSPWG